MAMTKYQKIVVAISILWEIACLIFILSSDEYFFSFDRRYLITTKEVAFLVFSLPVIIYWLGVWIWGFGFVKNIVPHQKNIVCLERIKRMFSFNGQINRGDFIGMWIFFYIVPYFVLAFSSNIELAIIVKAFCIYGFLNITIKRAASFTDTPWFFGVFYLVFVCFSTISQYDRVQTEINKLYYNENIMKNAFKKRDTQELQDVNTAKNEQDTWVWQEVNIAKMSVLDDDAGKLYSVPVSFDEQDVRFAIATQELKVQEKKIIEDVIIRKISTKDENESFAQFGSMVIWCIAWMFLLFKKTKT